MQVRMGLSPTRLARRRDPDPLSPRNRVSLQVDPMLLEERIDVTFGFKRVVVRDLGEYVMDYVRLAKAVAHPDREPVHDLVEFTGPSHKVPVEG